VEEFLDEKSNRLGEEKSELYSVLKYEVEELFRQRKPLVHLK
jgi:hypothetical protein